MMKYHLLIIVFFLFLSLSVCTEEIKTVEAQAGIPNCVIQAGFESYYRPGEWCPVTIKISGDNAFNGYLEINTGNINYKNQIKIPARANKEIFIPILISLPASQIKFSLYSSITKNSIYSGLLEQSELQPTIVGSKSLPLQLPIYSGSIPVKAVEPNRFLIGVEKRLSRIFLSEFSRYTEAAQHSYFFTFLPDELPQNWQALESIDLLVISEDTLRNDKVKETIELWQKASNGNILIMHNSQQLDLRAIARLKSRHHDNSIIAPEVYNLFDKPRWFNQTKQSLYKFLAIYFLLTLSILIISLWFRNKPKYFLIMLSALIGLNILSFGVIVIAGVIPPDFIIERLSINYKDAIFSAGGGSAFGMTKDQFLSINPLKDKIISVPVNNKFIKPLYPNVNSLEKSPQISILNENGIIKVTSKLKGLLSFILKQNLIRESEPNIKAEYKILENHSQYRVTNKTNGPMEKCFILTAKGCAYLGNLNSGETKEVKLTNNDFMDWGQFLSGYLTGYERTAIYQKRLLEMWYDKYFPTREPINSLTRELVNSLTRQLLIGWNNSPISPCTNRTIVDYPELWIIPLEETP